VQALVEDCTPGAGVRFGQDEVEGEEASVTNGNIVATATGTNAMTFKQADNSKILFTIEYTFGASIHNCSYNCSNVPTQGYSAVNLTVTAGDKDERIFGLGQGNWNQADGCSDWCGTPRDKQEVIPLERNGKKPHLPSNNNLHKDTDRPRWCRSILC